MGEADLHSKRLEWIRDGSNWLVGVATGALVLSGTYFYDRFQGAPHGKFPMIAAWVLLAISALSGVFTSFSAWRDLRVPAPDAAGAPPEPPALGPWVKWSYNIMMWTFVLGYVLLAGALISNVATSGSGQARTIKKIEVILPLESGDVQILVSPRPGDKVAAPGAEKPEGKEKPAPREAGKP